MLDSSFALDNLVKTHLRDLEHEARVRRALRTARRELAAPGVSDEASAASLQGDHVPRRLQPHARLAARTGMKAGA